MCTHLPRYLSSIAAITSLILFQQSHAGELGSFIEVGVPVNVDGADTFLVDGANDGENANTAVTFNNDATNAIDSLTVSSDGADANDTGEIGSITVLDNNGINTLIINDSTNTDVFNFKIGNINGNVDTDSNDLRITVNAAFTDNNNGINLLLSNNVNLGTGSLLLNGDATDEASVIFTGTANQTVTATILSALNDVGSSILIRNGANTVTFENTIGTEGTNGIATLLIGGNGGAQANALFNGSVDANTITINGSNGASTADFNAAVTGANINLISNAAGAVSANFSNNVSANVTLTDATNEATLTFDGITAQSINGTINGAAAGQGNVIVTGSNVTFSNTIGTTAIDLFQVDGTATVANITTTAANAATIGIDANNVLNVAATAADITLQETVGDIDIDGTLSISGNNNVTLSAANSDLDIDGTFNSALTGTAKTVTLIANDASLVSLGANTDTTLNISNQIVTTGNTTIGNTGRTTTISIKKSTDFDPNLTSVINAADDVVSVTGSLNINVDSTSPTLTGGETITVIDSNENAGTSYAVLFANGSITLTDTALIDLQNDNSDAQDLKIKVVAKAAPDGAIGNAASALSQSLAATQNDLAAQSALLSLLATQTQSAGEQLAADPSTIAAIGHTTAANTVTGFHLISDHLASTRTGTNSTHTGLAAGDTHTSSTIWGRFFSNDIKQDAHTEVSGFDATSRGIMFPEFKS